MKLKPLLLASMICGSSVLLVGCGPSSQSSDSDQKPTAANLSSETNPNLMPPTGDQTSTMDVKTKNLEAAQPEQTSEAPAPDIDKAEPEKTAIENEPHPPAKTGKEIFATCAACHGEQGQGGVGPKLQGQKATTIIAKLKAYKAGKTFGPMSSMMIPNAQQLSEQDIEAVAAYIAKL